MGRPRSARALREEQLGRQIARVHADNYGVYGARKVWLQLNREGVTVAQQDARSHMHRRPTRRRAVPRRRRGVMAL